MNEQVRLMQASA
jgi:hypothetical protein